MLVAPYSPSARAKASTVPARMPWRQYGIRTRQKIHAPDCPSVWADQASVSSKLSNAPRAVRYISGKATTMDAKMALYQFMTSLTPKCSMKKMPSGRFAPKSSSRK